jgi:tripartite-type tricarboxylate transporter receptor subunit TctC
LIVSKTLRKSLSNRTSFYLKRFHAKFCPATKTGDNIMQVSKPSSFSRRQVLAMAAAAPLASAFTGSAFAQSAWPTRPVRIIVPFSAGGAGDTSARSLGQRISTALGQPVVIENRTGGNAVIAANALLQSPRDGYTFIWDAANQLTNQVLLRDLPFNYQESFAPVTLAVRAPQALVVHSSFPANTFAEFLKVAKERPGQVSCGTPPSGAMGHLAMALLEQRAGIKLLHTPYRGGADAARDVTGGQINSALITVSTARQTLGEGRAKMLVVTSAKRNPAFPDVPTIAESGFDGYDMDDWFGLFAASGTPQEAIRKMQGATAQAIKDPELARLVAPLGIELVASPTQEFAAWLNNQRAILQKLIRDNNITIS